MEMILYMKKAAMIPEILRPLYREVSKYFGSDDYFSFWLCRYVPDVDGLSITYWDHDARSEIDDAIYMNIYAQ